MRNFSLENQPGVVEERRIGERGREVHSRAMGRLKERRFDDGVDELSVGAPVEDLGCPSCRKAYPFGDVCPSCDVLLVSYSLVDSTKPEPNPSRPGWLRRLFARTG